MIHLDKDGVYRLAEFFVLTASTIEFSAAGQFCGCPFADTFKIDSAHDFMQSLGRFALSDTGAHLMAIDRVNRALDCRP